LKITFCYNVHKNTVASEYCDAR